MSIELKFQCSYVKPCSVIFTSVNWCTNGNNQVGLCVATHHQWWSTNQLTKTWIDFIKIKFHLNILHDSNKIEIQLNSTIGLRFTKLTFNWRQVGCILGKVLKIYSWIWWWKKKNFWKDIEPKRCIPIPLYMEMGSIDSSLELPKWPSQLTLYIPCPLGRSYSSLVSHSVMQKLWQSKNSRLI